MRMYLIGFPFGAFFSILKDALQIILPFLAKLRQIVNLKMLTYSCTALPGACFLVTHLLIVAVTNTKIGSFTHRME